MKPEQGLCFQANEQCYTFLRTHCADNKALAVLVLAEKKNIAYPQVPNHLRSHELLYSDIYAGLEGEAVVQMEVEGQ